jgi:hypothetical protein
MEVRAWREEGDDRALVLERPQTRSRPRSRSPCRLAAGCRCSGCRSRWHVHGVHHPVVSMTSEPHPRHATCQNVCEHTTPGEKRDRWPGVKGCGRSWRSPSDSGICKDSHHRRAGRAASSVSLRFETTCSSRIRSRAKRRRPIS